MKHLKKIILPILSLIFLIIFIALAYNIDYVFLDKIIICSLILGIIFLIKIINERNISNLNTNSNNSDLIKPKK